MKNVQRNAVIVSLWVISIVLTGGTGYMVTAEQTEEISLDFTSSPYSIVEEGGYHKVSMKGFFTRGLPGAPELPQRVYNVQVPSDTDLDTVSVEIVSAETQVLSGEYEIAPGPVPASKDAVYEGTLKMGKDTTIYEKDAFYPGNTVEMLRTYQVRDTKYVRIQFTAMQYNPVVQKLQVVEAVSISVKWNNKKQVKAPPAATWSGYAIITTNAIVSNSANLSAFITHLQGRGFTVTVVTETQYGLVGGQQRAINIRNWLVSNYNALQLQYVLLIGNPDPNIGDVPMMLCWPNPGSAADRTPTDYFYADLTGNWDLDGDTMYGEFGEDAVDFGPEVYVGRIPVYGADYATLDTILNKTINYDGANKSIMLPMAISNYQDEHTATNTCLDGSPRTDGLDLAQHVIQNITGPKGYTDYTMYEQSGFVGRGHDPVPLTAFGYRAPITNANVMTQWAADYGIVFWWGHGGQTAAFRKYWGAADDGDNVVEDGFCGAAGDELVWSAFLSSGDTAALPDTETFVFQSSCLNGYPENPNNLGYALLRQGAVCTVSASRVSWYVMGQWSYWGIIDNAGIGYTYVNLLVNGSSAGKALYDGKNGLVNPWIWIGWMNLFDFNLYGDPSLRLGIPQPMPATPESAYDDNKNMCALCNNRIREAETLILDIQLLIDKAKGEGKDTVKCEEMLNQGNEALEKTFMYYPGNCIAGNNWVIKAIALFKKAKECLGNL